MDVVYINLFQRFVSSALCTAASKLRDSGGHSFDPVKDIVNMFTTNQCHSVQIGKQSGPELQIVAMVRD